MSGSMGRVAAKLSSGLSIGSIRFKSRLWLGHSRTFRDLSRSHSCVVLAMCLGSLSCWKVNLRLFNLRMMEATVFSGNSAMLQKCFDILPQICASTQSCLRVLRNIPLTSWLGFCSVNCGTLSRQVCAFPNHVQSIDFTTGGLQSSCRNISRMINGNRMHLSSISRLIAKGLNTYVNKVFMFFLFNTFAKL